MRHLRSQPIRRIARGLAFFAVLVTSLGAQDQFRDMLRKGYLPTDDDETRAVAFGDVDGDGDLDVVLGNHGEQNRLYQNDGSGAFADVTATRMPVVVDSTAAVVLGDVDGDGDLDLAIANHRQNRLYENDGSGTFTDVTSTRLPNDGDFTEAVALGDVDGDGDLDLVFGSGTPYSKRNRLYLNDGAGRFVDATASRLPPHDDWTQALALVDVDGDGDFDLVLGNYFQNRLYLNDGRGTFTDATSRVPVSNDFTRAVVATDVDGDGDFDLVLGNGLERQNNLYLNDGLGTFTDATASRLPVDLRDTRTLASRDVDGDGDPDLVLGNGGQRNQLYLNDGSGVFVDATLSHLPQDIDPTDAVALGDVDGDGDVDLLFGNGDLRQNRLHINDGAAVFTDASVTRLPAHLDYTRAATLGDVDGDGYADIVFGNALENRLFRNDGHGIFTDAIASRLPVNQHNTSVVALHDVDGDGDLDLVSGNASSFTGTGQNRLYLNDGTGTFAEVTAARMPVGDDQTEALAIGDVDGDGDPDLVFGNTPKNNAAGGQNRLYLNDANGVFTDATAARMPADNHWTGAVDLGDVDGDGDLDLVVGNYLSQQARGRQNRLYVNDGAGTFTDATASRMPVDNDYTRAAAFADVDGDGDLDLIFGNVSQAVGTNRLYLNDGSGAFTDVTATRMPTDSDWTNAVAVGDVDGDGAPDLVFGNHGLRRNRFYRNDGRGTFTDATAALPARDDFCTAVSLADVDGDGDLDLVTANQARNKIYVNLLRQLDTPRLVVVGGSYRLDVHAHHGPPRTIDVVVPYLSSVAARIPLPPFGVIGIDPSSMVALPGYVIPQPAGFVSVSIPVPNNPSLAGLSIYCQALLSQRSSHLTNTVSDRVVR